MQRTVSEENSRRERMGGRETRKADIVETEKILSRVRVRREREVDVMAVLPPNSIVRCNKMKYLAAEVQKPRGRSQTLLHSVQS